MKTRDGDTFLDLCQRFLRPSEGREDAIRSSFASSSTRGSAARFWETLATRGFIPDTWVQAVDRSFVREPWGQTFDVAPKAPLWLIPRVRRVAHPTTIEAAITLAADVPGVLRAEESARQAYARRAAILADVRPLAGIAWRVLPAPSDRWRKPTWGDPSEARLRLMMRAQRGSSAVKAFENEMSLISSTLVQGMWARFGAHYPGRRNQINEAPIDGLHELARSTLALDCAQREGLVLPPQLGFTLKTARPLADFPNHFAPLLDVYDVGYACEGDLFDGASNWLVLVAAARDPSRMPKSTW